MGKGKQLTNDQVRERVEQADAEALGRCDEIVYRILRDVESLRDRFEDRAWSNCSNLIQFQDLPYKEMLDAISDQISSKEKVPEVAQLSLAAARTCKRRPATPNTAAPRTLRARAGQRQMAPAPTPAVAALNDVGYNVTCVRKFQMEVDLPDGTKRILTNEDFATMNPADMKGTKLEQLLAEALRLKQPK